MTGLAGSGGYLSIEPLSTRVGPGVTSGLDLALYLVERELGPRIALAVEELFAYERRGTVWRRHGAEPHPW
jgi:hypothetical protein